MKDFRVLVTGCGGDIGQSIGKILKSHSRDFSVFGCDLHDQHAGLFIFDKCYIVPRVSNGFYFSEINGLLTSLKIDIIVVTSESELRFISERECLNDFDCKFKIVPNYEALSVGFDKLLTSKLLSDNMLPTPKTIILRELQEVPVFPCIIKNRQGAGSKGVFFVKDIEEFKFYRNKFPDFIYQEFLLPEEGEFTCGVFRSNEGTRSIIFKRNLMGGFSGYGEVVNNENVSLLLYKIADLLSLQGSINVQLRIVSGIPYVFEINPRFSSTVLFRHMFGFTDVLWAIEAKTDTKVSSYIPVKEGAKFFKGFSEFITLLA
jgi:carbamoyl-phosphate synthase large subunit